MLEITEISYRLFPSESTDKLIDYSLSHQRLCYHRHHYHYCHYIIIIVIIIIIISDCNLDILIRH